MPCLIDSDWLIDHLDDTPEASDLLRRLTPEGVAISIITYIEALEGTFWAIDPSEAISRFEGLVSSIPVIRLDSRVARRAAILRYALRSQGRRLNSRPFDLLIAATALAYDLSLVTRNVEDFEDIPNLQILRH